MHLRKKARSEDGLESSGNREMVVAKAARQNGTQGDAKNSKMGSRWEESVLEKWRGALVKARLALHKKREKKKEKHVKSTLARLRKIADAARKSQADDKLPRKSAPPKKRGRPPLASKVGKARGLAAVATERTSTKIPKKAKTTSSQSQERDRNCIEPIVSVTKAKRGRKPFAGRATDLDEAEVARLRAEMERKEEIKNKWRNVEIARSALQQKRARRKEQAQKAARRRLGCFQAAAVQDNILQVGFSFKRPSLEELRNFAKKSRS